MVEGIIGYLTAFIAAHEKQIVGSILTYLVSFVIMLFLIEWAKAGDK